MQHDILRLTDSTRYLVLLTDVRHLWQVTDGTEWLSLTECVSNGNGGLLTHAVADEVGRGVTEDAGAQTVFPVVVMGESAQGSLDAAEHDGHVGEELTQYLGVDNAGLLGTAVVATVRREGILGAQSLGGGVFVYHRVHAPGRDGEEEARPTEFLEVTEVAVPVRLWHDGHLIASSL